MYVENIKVKSKSYDSVTRTQQSSLIFCVIVVVNFLKRLWKPLWMSLAVFGFLWSSYLILRSFPHHKDIELEIHDSEQHNINPKIILPAPQSEWQSNENIKTKRYPNYYEDNLRPNWTFQMSKNYDDHLLHYWTEPIKTINKSDKWTQGENGASFIPSEDEINLMNELQKEHNYNVYASDRISLQRTLPDHRIAECRVLLYPEKLPKVSVIIVVHNEVWSTLLRTVWSIINRSPVELLEEIILVDDASTWPFLKRPLDDYIELLSAQVRIVRTSQREGLIRARLIGARNATGSVLTFLDAHMECSEGWLQPTLARIANDRSVVVVPLIDAIDSDNMDYIATGGTVITPLRWNLIFYWGGIPEKERLRTKNDPTAPIRTPSHVGCAFSIDREFFFEIGSYDEKMDIWGSENVELAFRVWMCGGSLEILPCSRIAHLFRISTYSFNGNANEIKNRNNVRLVEVWMDEFKELFYAANPNLKLVAPGDLTDRKHLRERLKCKSFRWFLENVYSDSTWLKDFIVMGQIVSGSTSLCLDIFAMAEFQKMSLERCHGLGGNQFFAFTKSGQILNTEQLCAGVVNREVVSLHCSEQSENQLWDYDSKNQWIVHRESKECMQEDEGHAKMGACNSSDPRFQWTFKVTPTNNKALKKENAD